MLKIINGFSILMTGVALFCLFLYHPVLENSKNFVPYIILLVTIICFLIIIKVLIVFLNKQAPIEEKESNSLQNIRELEYELLNLKNIERVPTLICEMAIMELGESMAWIGLSAENSGQIMPVAQAGSDSDDFLRDIRVTNDNDTDGIGPTACCIREKRYITLSIAKGYNSHLPTNQESLRDWENLLGDKGYQSCVAFPLLVNEEVLGSLTIYSKCEENKLLDKLTHLQAFSYIAAIAIDNLKKVNKDRASFQELVKMLSFIIDARDHYTAFHSANVANYARGIGEQLNLSAKQLKEVELCGLLHDIGKIYIADKILHKAGPLDFEERKVVQTHAVLGSNILSQSPNIFNLQIVKGIMHHHERHDGRGYPDGLSGEAIPFYAQILAVADAFDAMTTERPYRKALPHEVALSEIRSQYGKQFSPDVVDAFLEFMDHGEEREDCL